jgi:hypothetical protein
MKPWPRPRLYFYKREISVSVQTADIVDGSCGFMDGHLLKHRKNALNCFLNDIIKVDLPLSF